MFANLLLSAAAVFLLGTGVAFAEPAAESADDKPGHERPMGDLDADKDGSISDAESEAHATKKFDEIDADKDGTVTMEEMEKYRDNEKAEREAKRLKREAVMKDRYREKVDPDGDGKITREEFIKSARERHARMDANRDGDITRAEVKERMSKLGEHGKGSKPADAPPVE